MQSRSFHTLCVSSDAHMLTAIKRSSYTITKPSRNLCTKCFVLKRLSRRMVSLATFTLSYQLGVEPTLSPQPTCICHFCMFGCSLQYVCKQLSLCGCGEAGQCTSPSPNSDTDTKQHPAGLTQLIHTFQICLQRQLETPALSVRC